MANTSFARGAEDDILSTVVKIERAGLEYQPFYCEENVWRLLARPELKEAATWAVLVSNAERKVILLRQLAGRPVDGLVHWDYHAFAVVAHPVMGRLALDLDSDLPFPCSLSRYLGDTFPAEAQKAFAPRFRVMKGAEYVAGLVSDRSHMRRADGSYIAPPPPWPAPGGGSGSVLMSWLDMGSRSPGALYDVSHMSAFAEAEKRKY
jgi:protein N-terminal glutamine amidohydrolase